jgi:hypothetical protein
MMAALAAGRKIPNGSTFFTNAANWATRAVGDLHEGVQGEEFNEDSDNLTRLDVSICLHNAVFNCGEDVTVTFVVRLFAPFEDAVDLGSDISAEDDVEAVFVGWTDPDWVRPDTLE